MNYLVVSKNIWLFVRGHLFRESVSLLKTSVLWLLFLSNLAFAFPIISKNQALEATAFDFFNYLPLE